MSIETSIGLETGQRDRVGDAADLVRHTRERLERRARDHQARIDHLTTRDDEESRRELRIERQKLAAVDNGLGKLRTRAEQDAFVRDFTTAVDEDMRSRDRQAAVHPMLPYSPEPNLFVDGLLTLGRPEIRFGVAGAEFLLLAERLHQAYGEELAVAHGVASPADLPTDILTTDVQVDSQNNRHPDRDLAFMTDFVGAAPPTDDEERQRARPASHRVSRAGLPAISRSALSAWPRAEMARRVGVSRPAVWRWQCRFAEAGTTGLLRDKTRPPGTPPLPAETVARVVAMTCAEPPGEATQWTGRAMAAAGDVARVDVAVHRPTAGQCGGADPSTGTPRYWHFGTACLSMGQGVRHRRQPGFPRQSLSRIRAAGSWRLTPARNRDARRTGNARLH